MVKPAPFHAGDLVFAKVKGYPAWPARITNITPNGRLAVFFYGTYENAVLKKTEVFPFSKENQENFIPKNLHRKNYEKGVYEIRNTPEIAPGGPDEFDIPEDDLPKHTPIQEKPEKLVAQHSAPAAVVRKPLKLSDGTPIKAVKKSDTPPKSDTGGRRGTKRPAEDSEPEGSSATPQSSRSGRIIKQKKFSDDVKGEGDIKTEADLKPRSTSQIDDPRKIWVKKKNSADDLIEIQLDKEKPERWESHDQKLRWTLSTARNASRLKEFVELGEYIPNELIEVLKTKSQLTPEEKNQLKKVSEQAARREKITWLMREQELVDTNIAIRTALQTKNPDTEECVSLLQCLLRSEEVDPLMVVKQPTIIQTVRLLRGYQGPADLGQLEEKERERTKRNVRNINSMAETIYKKIVAKFNFKETATNKFQDHLNSEVKAFDLATAGLRPNQKLALTKFPTTAA